SSTTDYSNCSGPLPITSAQTWQVPGPQGGTVTYKFCYVTFQLNFNLYPGTNHYPFNENVGMLQSIVLPNLTSWTFQYDPNWGMLTKITLPTGGSMTYAAHTYFGCGNSSSYPKSYNASYVSRTVDANDGTGGHTWLYQFNSQPVNVTDPLGNV